MAATVMTNKDSPQALLYKTKMCAFFKEKRCRYGKNCAFAHDQKELGAQPDLIKTSFCLAWMEGTCRFSSEQCRFAHGKHEIRNAGKKTTPPKMVQDPIENSKAPLVFDAGPLLRTPPGLFMAAPAGDAHGFHTSSSPQMPLDRDTHDFLTSYSPHVMTLDAMLTDPMKVPPPPAPHASSEREPMKVFSSLMSGDVRGRMTAPKLTERAPFGLWDHWESETTVTGDTSSDDDGSLASNPLPRQGQSSTLRSALSRFGRAPGLA